MQYDPATQVYFGTLLLPPICDANAAQHVAAAAQLARLYPAPEMSGRGIVICGGGRYLPSTYVSVRLLRANGCHLPIQVWHLGSDEVPPDAAACFDGLGVEFKDARELQRSFPHKRLGGWEIKAFALLHCSWREVILLDADSLQLRDVTALFDWALYQENGALFWPDRGRWPPEAAVWALSGVPYRDEAEFESGQIVVDRARCWAALVLSNWFNAESAYWYTKIHGDKDTFRLAWRALEQPYGMIPHMGTAPWPYFYQKDPAGEIAFHHGLKWQEYLPNNPPLPHVPPACYDFIADYVAGKPRPVPVFGHWQHWAVDHTLDQLADKQCTGQHVADLTPSAEILAQIATLPAGSTVLDFGCGVGRNLIPAALQFPALSFVGYDSSDMLVRSEEYARQKHGISLSDIPNLQVRAAWSELREMRFALVYATLVFQHISPIDIGNYLADIKHMTDFFVVWGRRHNDFGGSTLDYFEHAGLYPENAAEINYATHGDPEEHLPPCIYRRGLGE